MAGTVCGGLDGQGHIGYAAQAGLASFGPDVFTAQHFTAVTAPPGYAAVGGSGAKTLYCPVHVNLGSRERHGASRGTVASVAIGGAAGASGCGTSGGEGGNGGNGSRRPATAATVATVATAPARPRECQRDLAHHCRHPDDARQHAALQRAGGNGGDGGNGGNGFNRFPGGNGGNGAQRAARAARPERRTGQEW